VIENKKQVWAHDIKEFVTNLILFGQRVAFDGEGKVADHVIVLHGQHTKSLTVKQADLAPIAGGCSGPGDHTDKRWTDQLAANADVVPVKAQFDISIGQKSFNSSVIDKSMVKLSQAPALRSYDV
jgi:hypothetical protein